MVERTGRWSPKPTSLRTPTGGDEDQQNDESMHLRKTKTDATLLYITNLTYCNKSNTPPPVVSESDWQTGFFSKQHVEDVDCMTNVFIYPTVKVSANGLFPSHTTANRCSGLLSSRSRPSHMVKKISCCIFHKEHPHPRLNLTPVFWITHHAFLRCSTFICRAGSPPNSAHESKPPIPSELLRRLAPQAQTEPANRFF